MAFQWSGRIAGNSNHFRGTSTVGIGLSADTFPKARALSDAVYILRVTGGVSGSFGATVIGQVGMQGSALFANGIVAGTTVPLAGVTAISGAGTYVLFPYGYSVSGVGTLTDRVDTLQRLDKLIPPTEVAFQSGVGTAGISAHCIINACIRLV